MRTHHLVDVGGLLFLPEDVMLLQQQRVNRALQQVGASGMRSVHTIQSRSRHQHHQRYHDPTAATLKGRRENKYTEGQINELRTWDEGCTRCFLRNKIGFSGLNRMARCVGGICSSVGSLTLQKNKKTKQLFQRRGSGNNDRRPQDVY